MTPTSPRVDISGMRTADRVYEIEAYPGPPSDSAAECALLHEALWWPNGVRALRAVRLSELLYGFWEHQRIWESMQRVFDSTAWPLEPLRNTQWHAALEVDCGRLLLGVVEDHWCDLNGGFHRRSWSSPDVLPGHWLVRLRRCKEARQLISNAQEQAERAWRLDIEAARRVAQRAAAPTIVSIKDRLLSV